MDVCFFVDARELLRGWPQLARQVDPDRFIRSSGRGPKIEQEVPAVGNKVGFLSQFSLRGSERGFVRPVIEQPGRYLPVPSSYWVTVLRDQQHPLGFIHGKHRHRSGVVDKLPLNRRAVIVDTVADNVPDPSVMG